MTLNNLQVLSIELTQLDVANNKLSGSTLTAFNTAVGATTKYEIIFDRQFDNFFA